jgi:hypothetical protein
MRKYQVTDSRGIVHKRNSVRLYTHAVVAHVPGRPAQVGYPAHEPVTNTAWTGSPRLAEREANRWRNHSAKWTVEVIEAQVVS